MGAKDNREALKLASIKWKKLSLQQKNKYKQRADELNLKIIEERHEEKSGESRSEVSSVYSIDSF